MATDEPRPTHKSQPSTATIVPLEIQVPDHANEYQELEPNSILFESSPLSAVTPTPLTLHQTLISTSTSNALDLDALLSPTITDSETQSIRESVAASDIADEERFSTVLLTSARQSLDSPEGVTADVGSSTSVISDENSTGDLQDTNVLSGDDLVRLVHTSRAHKKTASTSTIMSSNNVNFFLGRLEAQEEDRSRPQSIDGQQKLQEEFSKMQSDQDRQTQETSANLIDWGMCSCRFIISSFVEFILLKISGEMLSLVRGHWAPCLGLSECMHVIDYQKFAEEHPDELAKAIEKGIPKSLRGMIWQLMSVRYPPQLPRF